MKNKTSKPGKQRKRLFQAPYHMRGKILSAHLSSELRNSYNTRSLPIRRGDAVRILRGDYKGVEGKVLRVDRKKYRIFIEGITRQKSDGTTVLVPIHPSKVKIIRLNLDDKNRKRILERKGFTEETKGEEAEAAGTSPKNIGGA
ncbi:MAG: 50S ribosomal protein L24 [Candidatus Bathyarchaeia archaeon]|nr:50S ribosomal protein L24 [Candidatus Bathyarchaeota archaeon]